MLRNTVLFISCSLAATACGPTATTPNELVASRASKPDPVAVRIPPEPRAEIDDAPLEQAPTETGIVATLAADASEHAKRLEAMTKARGADIKATPEIHWVEPPSTHPSIKASNNLGKSSSNAKAIQSPIAIPLVPQPSDPKAMADAVVTALEARTESSRPVARALAAAALSIKEPDREFDVASFGSLDDDETSLVTRFHDACSTIGRELANGKPAGEAAQALAAMTASLAEPKSMVIPRVEMCTKVEGFGRVTALDNRRFLPGKSTQVILYTEVDDFASEKDDKTSEWTTNLASKVSIYAKHDGTQVWSRDWQHVTDRSTVKRDDFFICEKVALSDFLTVGTYVMKQSVRDDKTGAVAEKSLEFQIVADPALAAK